MYVCNNNNNTTTINNNNNTTTTTTTTTTTINCLSIKGKYRKIYIIPEWLRYSSNQIRSSSPK